MPQTGRSNSSSRVRVLVLAFTALRGMLSEALFDNFKDIIREFRLSRNFPQGRLHPFLALGRITSPVLERGSNPGRNLRVDFIQGDDSVFNDLIPFFRMKRRVSCKGA